MFALGSEQKAVQPLVLPHRTDAVQPAGEHLMDIPLVADVEDKFVLWRLKDAMERDR
jgi:hypothetical protein